MHLLLFDIDGTLVDSIGVDDQCFVQTFLELYDIDLSQADWNTFVHVTDLGITNEVFRTHFNRTPTEDEVIATKAHFYNLLKARINEVKEIEGATKILGTLVDRSDCTIAFATGGWKETALLKLDAIGFEVGALTLISSNDHFNRSEITKLAITKTLAKRGLTAFETITYIGDGLWDLQSAKELGINFIGIDHKGNDRLLNAGATQVTNNLEDVELIMSWINGKEENQSDQISQP